MPARMPVSCDSTKSCTKSAPASVKTGLCQALAAVVLCAADIFAAAPTVTFTTDGVNAMQFVYTGESLTAQPVDLKLRNGNPLRRTEYFFNAKLDPATFATMDVLGRWQEVYAKRTWKDPLKEPTIFSVREDGDLFRFYVNGVYLNYMPKGNADITAMSFKQSVGFPLPVEFRVEKTSTRFETVDITEQVNASGMPGRNNDAQSAGQTEVIDGIPFLRSRNPKSDNIDLSMSWNPAAFRTGYAACHAHRRWPCPLVKMPLRYQFRVPGRDYDALYVLCAADGSKPNTIPRFTAQFYRWRKDYAGSGRPFNFRSEAVPVGQDGNLYVVRIPISGDMITEFGPEEYMNFELTKDVFPYRTYADPLNHSWHAGGLPSNVRVYGITLSKSPVKCSFDPFETANIFAEDEKTGYNVTLENTTDKPVTETLSVSVADWYGKDKFSVSAQVSLAPGEKKTVPMELNAKLFGWYKAELKAFGRTWNHSFVRLRKREYDMRPFEEKCIRAGTWTMFDSPLRAYITGKGGWDTACKSETRAMSDATRKELDDVLRRYGMCTFAAPGNIRAQRGITSETPLAEGIALYESKMPDVTKVSESEFFFHRHVSALAEPGGVHTGNAEFPEYFGELENAYDYRKLEGDAKRRFNDYKRQIQVAHAVLSNRYPKAKLLIPHGSWNFLIPYLQDPDTRDLTDGVQMDFQYYTRLPEQQLHQCSLNSIMILNDNWRKYRGEDHPFMVWGEGPDVTQVYPGGSSDIGAASHRVRISMLMAAYGCNIQTSWGTSVFSHGENHCAGGLVTGNNARDPDLHYAAFSAWLRHARHATHESFTFPGSTSAFVQNFRDHKTGNLFRAVWTVRGERDFFFDCPPEKLTVYDPMDNIVPAANANGKSVVHAGEMPFFVYGAEGVDVTLGTPTHPDACVPQSGRDLYAKDAPLVKLGEMGSIPLAQTDDADTPYVDMMPDYIRRFQTKMDIASVMDSENPGQLLSVGLPTQQVDRMTMPYFTCLKFKQPVKIPGKAQALRLDVKAASDWGRVVYVLKDASGKRWYSCGRAGDWNADDMEGDSVFCFDGWRTLRFELPYNEPWDGFRNVGYTNWGREDGALDAKVVLPLALEKIFVERRSGVIYGCEFRKFEKDTPVLLGTLSAEYANEEDETPAAYAMQKIVAPSVPAASLVNPIADMKKVNSLEPGKITSLKEPDTWFDGTRGIFSFEMPTNAVNADIWMSLYEDGRGALKLGSKIKSSPQQVQGFLADTEFYAFLIWRDKDGNESKPSDPFKFKLTDHFGHQ